MSWPYGPAECPRCSYFDPLDAPALDDAGYEVVALCLHPRIATELFRSEAMEARIAPCPCFTPAG